MNKQKLKKVLKIFKKAKDVYLDKQTLNNSANRQGYIFRLKENNDVFHYIYGSKNEIKIIFCRDDDGLPDFANTLIGLIGRPDKMEEVNKDFVVFKYE